MSTRIILGFAFILSIIYGTSCNKCEEVVCFECESPLVRVINVLDGDTIKFDSDMHGMYGVIKNMQYYDTTILDTLNAILLKDITCFTSEEVNKSVFSTGRDQFYTSKYCKRQ